MEPVSSAPDAPARDASSLDVERLRADFPILSEEVNGEPLVYLDNAATSQKPRQVLEAISGYYASDNANVHRGIHELSRRATDAFEGARQRVARFLGTEDPGEVIWTRGTTEAINLVASSWGGANVGEGDEIVLSDMEHHSNLVPWQLLAARTGARLRFVELADDGTLALEGLAELLSERTKLVALTQVSNSLGTINPIREIADQVHDAGALLLVDGAQGAAHAPVDVASLGADFYAFSGHKMCGPTGIGALWARRELLEAMPPYQGGGEMISLVERHASTWADLPHKFEAGTPNIAGAVGMAAALDYLEGVGHHQILRHEQALVAHAMERLSQVEGLRMFGPADPTRRAGVVSFVMEEAHAHDIATILDSKGIAVRAGHHCTQLVMKRYGVPATARASFYLYNTHEEVDRFADALGRVQSIFG
ncbi:MAG: cysteine desulfurase [Gemmatimonadales bacterium]|nr:MAG: cysteine desulfurase [Gemmatimonadales bacterium]